MSSVTLPLSEQGQLVDVRQRRYIVTEVEASTLPPPAWSSWERLPWHISWPTPGT